MARFTPDPGAERAHGARTSAGITDISFCAWVAQAEPGDALVYHRGFLVVDTDRQLSSLPKDQRLALCCVADAAFRAAEQGLVHLVQQRLGSAHFAYIAITRPRPKAAAVSLSALLLAGSEAA